MKHSRAPFPAVSCPTSSLGRTRISRSELPSLQSSVHEPFSRPHSFAEVGNNVLGRKHCARRGLTRSPRRSGGILPGPEHIHGVEHDYHTAWRGEYRFCWKNERSTLPGYVEPVGVAERALAMNRFLRIVLCACAPYRIPSFRKFRMAGASLMRSYATGSRISTRVVYPKLVL